jgi:hypothetical protein
LFRQTYILFSTYQSIYLSMQPYISALSIYPFLSIPPSMYPFSSIPSHLSFPPSIYPSIHLSLHPSIYPSIHLSLHPSIYPSIHLSQIRRASCRERVWTIV